MFKRVANSLFVLALLAFARTSFAFVEPPVLVPPNPVAGELVSVSITTGVCDTFAAYPPPNITRTGNSIQMNLSAVVAGDGFCVFPSGASIFPVGTFEPGAYSLQVDRTYSNIGGTFTETLGVIPFGVTAAAQVPALALTGMIALIALLLMASIARLRWL